MKRRLLLDSEVVATLERLSMRVRRALWLRLHEIAEARIGLRIFTSRTSGGASWQRTFLANTRFFTGTTLRIVT